jgi:hypothetical protein
MTKAVAWAFVLFVALAPVLNDVCGLSCVQSSAPSCPLHQQTPSPERCSHDHSAIRADIVRSHATTPAFVLLGSVPALTATLVTQSRASQNTGAANAPPEPSRLSVVLRI